MAEVQPIPRRGEKPVVSIPKKPPPKGTDQKHPALIFTDGASDGPLIGTLVVVVDKAKNLPNLKSIGKQDPYCVLRLGKHVKKTDPDKRGGQTPKWDAEHRFPVHDSADYRNLKVVIFTDDKKTELIGETAINLDKILDTAGGGQSDGWHQCKCRGRYTGEIRIELTFWDSRPKEAPPLIVNTHQVTSPDKEDVKRSDKPIAASRRPVAAAPRKRELPEKPNTKPPAKENTAPNPTGSGPEEEPELPPAGHRKDRDHHRDREPRERHRSKHRESRRDKSRHHARERDQRSPEDYDNGAYHHSPSHHAPYDAPAQYNGYYQQQPPNQVATLQEFQSDHIGKLQAQYVEQTQMIAHQRHSPNPAAYPAYQHDFYDGQQQQQQQQQQQWARPQDNSINAIALANQSGPPSLPQHRHVEFADTRRGGALPPSQPQHALQHRKSRSEFYPNRTPDIYQQGNTSYNNQLMSSSFAPAPPPRHGYDQQQYMEQPSYNNMQAFDQQNQFAPPPQPAQPQLQYQQNTGYEANYQDLYAEPPYQSQLARASDFAQPPPPPHHGQSSAYRMAPPAPAEEYNNTSALVLSQAAAPAPPPPAHRQEQSRRSMPAPPMSSQMQLPAPQKIPTPQPVDTYEQSFQLQSLRGFAPQLPSHGGSRFQGTESPRPSQQLQPLMDDRMAQIRARGNSEPPPYAAIPDASTSYQHPEPQSFSDELSSRYATQQAPVQAGGYAAAPAPTPAYTSFTDYSQAATPLSHRLSGLIQPQNAEHAFDPTTALVLSGGPPALPSHSGAGQANGANSQRGRNQVPPISTNFSPQKSHSRTPSPHPLSLTPGYGPDSPDFDNGNLFTQALAAAAPPEPPVQSNYHAPYVKDVTGRHSMDSRVDSEVGGISPLVQPTTQQIDANRRHSISPIPPPNTYSQELVSTRGGPPPPPPASHRLSQRQFVYKHDPSERPTESRSNRSSAYDFANRSPSVQATHNNNHSIPDSTYRQSAGNNWNASQTADDVSREYMSRSSVPAYVNQPKHTPPSSGKQSPYPEYGNDGLYLHSPGAQAAPIIKPRATSPNPGRRSTDIPRTSRTPEPDRRSPAPMQPLERKTTLGGMPFSPDDYDAINPVNSYNPRGRSPSGNVSTMPLARSPGSIAMSPGQYMTAKEEKKARREQEKAARKARKRFFTPNSANRDLAEDDILAPETFAPEPERRNSFNAGHSGGEDDYDDEDDDDDDDDEGVQPLAFQARRRSVSPQPPRGVSPQPPGRGASPQPPRRGASPQPPRRGASPQPPRRGVSPQPPMATDIYGTSPGGRPYGGGYGTPSPANGGGGHRPLPGAPVMRNAIMGPEDYYQQQQQQQQQSMNRYPPAAPMQMQMPGPGNMTPQQWSLSQELSSISIGTSSRRRTGTWT